MKNKKIKFIFWGTPDVASKTLEILKNNGYLPSLIVTSPDKPAGRGLHMTPSPVSIWANKNKIPCLKPDKIDDDFIEKLKIKIDEKSIILSIVVAYGKILPENLINLPKLGTINIHYSLLPKYRGASPLESALLNGDNSTGITIQQMVYKLDSGPIIKQKEIAIKNETTKNDLRENLIKLGAETLSKIIPEIIKDNIETKNQNESEASSCTKIKKSDGELNLKDNDKDNFNKYRAFAGWPGTFFYINNKLGKKVRIKITKAIYKNNSFIVERVIPEGKNEINYTDFIKNY